MLPGVLCVSNVMGYYKAKIFISLLYMSHLKRGTEKNLRDTLIMFLASGLQNSALEKGL